MATVIDLLRQLGQNMGPSGTNALAGPVELPAAPIAPLPIGVPRSLAAAWMGLTGRATSAPHALGLAASRAGESVCFAGPASAAREDLLLIIAAQLVAEPSTVALWLVADAVAAVQASALLSQVLPPAGISWRAVKDRPGRDDPAQLVLATYDELHTRLLPYSDRGWRWLWRRLRLAAVPDLQHASGTRASQLVWLMRRAHRLSGAGLQVLGAVATAPGTALFVQSLVGPACRTIDTRIARSHSALLVLWQCADRSAALAWLASRLVERGLAVTALGCSRQETEALRAENVLPPGLEIGQSPHAARVALVTGVPRSSEEREQLFSRGYRLVLMLAADEPHEQLFAAEPARLVSTIPAIPFTLTNPYIASAHLVCAAAELPISPAEIETWQVRDLVDRLLSRGLLHVVAGLAGAGEAGSGQDETLPTTHPSGSPIPVRDPGGIEIARLAPSVADWCGLPGTTWDCGLIVVHRGDHPPSIDLAGDARPHLALPQIAVRVTPRETLETRSPTLGSRPVTISRSRVHVEQGVTGIVDYAVGQAPQTLPPAKPLRSSWTGSACMLPLPVPPPDPASAGWSITAVLPLVMRTRPGDLLVSYDPSAHGLWLIETEQGGAGLASMLMQQMEHLLALAAALSRALTHSERYGAIARSELRWLRALLEADSPRATSAEVLAAVEAAPVERPAPPPQPTTAVRRTKVYALPPPNVSLPALRDGPSAPYDVAPEVARTAARSEPQSPALETAEPTSAELKPPDLDVTDQGRAPEAEAEPEVALGEAVQPPEPGPSSGETAIVDDVHWQIEPREDPDEVDDIAWQPDVAAEQPPQQPPLPEIPPLGHEAPVPLNMPRRPARYPAARASRGEDAPRAPAQPRRPGRRTDEGTRQEAPRWKRENAPRRPGQDPPGIEDRPASPKDIPEQPAVDVGAMIARMRRLREEREHDQVRSRPAPDIRPSQDEQASLRFHPGQRVKCVPYGEGVVRAARVVDGREQLSIVFKDVGLIEVDPGVSAVRALDESPAGDPAPDDA